MSEKEHQEPEQPPKPEKKPPPNLSYQELYSKYQKSILSTNVSLNTTFFIERQKSISPFLSSLICIVIDRYNKYSKYAAQQHLKHFINCN